MSQSNRTYYICPRCNHSTVNKADIRRHFKRTRLCPNKNAISLTPDIIETVMKDHIFRVEKVETGKGINNFNMILGILNGMESLDKVKLINDYQGTKTSDFEDFTEQKFDYIVKRLEGNAPTTGYFLTLDDLFNIVNNCTSREPETGETFNIFFDKVINRLKLYRSRKWESYLEESGIKQVISLLKSYYLDSYELYLIKNLHMESTKLNRWQFQEHLAIYYQFIAVFDLDPSVKNVEDVEIIGHSPKEDQADSLAKYYSNFYLDQKKELKESISKNIKRKILGIIKDNSVQNVRSLDRTIIELLKIDGNFRNVLLGTRQLVSSSQ